MIYIESTTTGCFRVSDEAGAVLTSTRNYRKAEAIARDEAERRHDWVAIISGGGPGLQVNGGLAVLGPDALRHARRVVNRRKKKVKRNFDFDRLAFERSMKSVTKPKWREDD